MKKFYVQDPTLNRFVYFDTVPQTVQYLNGLVERLIGKTRKSFMQYLIDLGHGYDDELGVTFTNAMAEKVNIGTVNKDKAHVRCNIHAMSNFNSPEYGD